MDLISAVNLSDESETEFFLERLFFTKNYDGCKKLCEKILEQYPESPEALFYLGKINLAADNHTKAIQYFKAAHNSDKYNFEITEQLFNLFSASLKFEEQRKILAESYDSHQLKFEHFLPGLNTNEAEELSGIYPAYFYKRIFKELKSIFNELVYSPVWNGLPAKIDDWKKSRLSSARFNWLLNSTGNILPGFHNFLKERLTENDNSIPLKESFQILNTGLIEVTQKLNEIFASIEKKNLETKLTFDKWKEQLKGRDEENLLGEFCNFVQKENIDSVLLHGSLADGKTEKGYSDFDVTFILDIPANASDDKLLSIAETVLKSNHFLLAYNPFMHHGPLITFKDELNWATEASFPSVLVENGVWLRGKINGVKYVDDGLDFILSFYPFDNFFTNNFQQAEDFHNPFDIIWWSSSVMFLPLLLTQMHKGKSIWKRDLFTNKNDFIPEKYWNLLNEVSQLRKKASELIQSKVSLPLSVQNFELNPGQLLKEAKSKYPVSAEEIQSIGITNQLINDAKEFWEYCKNSAFFYHLSNKNKSENKIKLFLKDWAAEVTEIPEPLQMEDYNETRKYFLNLCKSNSAVVSVYEFGNIGSPGLSDLDMLVVLDDSFNGLPHELLINNMPQKYADIFNHNPVFVSESSLPVLGSVYPLFNARKIYGKEQSLKLTSDFNNLIQLPLFTFINAVKYPRDIILLSKQNKIRWKTLLAYLNSFKHIERALITLGVPVPTSIKKCLHFNEKVRSDFKDGKKSIDDLRKALLFMLEASVDTLLVFEAIWAEVLPGLKKIYGLTDKSKYLNEVLESLIKNENDFPDLPRILNVIMLYLQKTDDKIDIPSEGYEKLKETLAEFSKSRKSFIRNEINHGRNIDHYIVGNAFSTLPAEKVQQDYSLANLEELKSPQFQWFMFKLNSFAQQHSLRKMIDWSKIWEYPWIWFHVLQDVDFEDKTIVDLGSEISPVPWLLALKGAKVFLIETDEQYVEKWKELNEKLGLNVQWKLVSDEIIPLPDNFADIITSFSVIEHQPDKNKAVQEVVRVLKPGGTFALSFDICEYDEGMTFPEWNGKAMTMKEFESVIWQFPVFQNSSLPKWNLKDVTKFWQWHLKSAEHHNYVTAAAIMKNQKTEIEFEDIKNITFVRLDSIGDNILASSMLPHIKHKFSDAKLTVICQEHISELYKSSPYVDEIIVVDKERFLADDNYRSEILLTLKKLNSDLVLNSVYSREEIGDEIVKSINSGIKIGFEGDLNNISEEDKSNNNNYYTNLISSFKLLYPFEMDLHKRFLNFLNINVNSLKPLIWLTEEDRKYAEMFLAEKNISDKKFIAVFGGAQYSRKNYTQFGLAIKNIVEQNNISVIALGDQKDFAVNQDNLDALTVPVYNLSGQTTFGQAAAILERSLVAVGVDTAFAHAACALKIPNVILLGGGHFGRFMPYSNFTSIVALPLDCYRCNWNCLYEKAYCVKDVDYKVIEEAVRQTINRKSEKARVFIQSNFQPEINKNTPAWYFDDELPGKNNVEIIKVNDSIPLDKIEELIQNKKYEEALQNLYGLLHYNNNDVNVLNNIAVVQILTKQWEDASLTLKSILEIDPANEVASGNIQYLEKQLVYHQAILESEELIKQQNYPDAKKLLNEILKYEPGHTDALNNLAVINIYENDFEEARKKLYKVLEINPEDEIATDNINYLNDLGAESQITKNLSNSENTFKPEKKDGISQSQKNIKNDKYSRLFDAISSSLREYHDGTGLRFEITNKPALNELRNLYLQVKELIIVKLDAIGDALLFSNSYKQLRLIFPNAKITVLCYTETEDITQRNPYIDTIIYVDRKSIQSNTGYWSRVIKSLSKNEYDILINPLYSRDYFSDEIVRFLNVKYKIGVSGDRSNIIDEVFNITNHNYDYLLKVKADEVKFELYRNAEIINLLGGESNPDSLPELWMKKEDESFVELFLTDYNIGSYAIVFPGGKGGKNSPKYWGSENFANLIDHLELKKKIKVLVFAGMGEDNICTEISSLCKSNPTILQGHFTIWQIAQFIKHSLFYIGTDTSITHLAASLKKHTIVLLGGGHFGRFFPYPSQKHVHAIYKKMECYHCNWICTKSTNECLKQIKVEDVLKSLKLDNDNFRSSRKLKVNVVNSSGSNPKIDVILPPGGNHSWHLKEGFVNNLSSMGLLNKVFHSNSEHYEHILKYIKTGGNSDFIIAMGGDHHLSYLHDSPEKRKIWNKYKNPKICYSYETTTNSIYPFYVQRSLNSAEVFTHILSADEVDLAFWKKLKKPVIWFPQFVDEKLFRPTKPLNQRKSKLFFKGKMWVEYEKRKNLIFSLIYNNLCDTKDEMLSTTKLINLYNEYVFCINPPGVFGGFNVRTFETLACENILLQYEHKNRPLNNALFKHGEHLVYFDLDNMQRTLNEIEYYIKHAPEYYNIAKAGREEVLKHHTVKKRIESLLNWIDKDETPGYPAYSKAYKTNKKVENKIHKIRHKNSGNLNFKVSAIVSSFNSEKFIKGCLDDLTNQTLYKKGELEIVVVVSGSEENEEEIVKEYQNKFSNIVLISTENRETVYQAWNRGIKKAKGKYITNANTDDRHKTDALEILANELDKNEDVALVYADSKVTQTENRTFNSTPLTGYLLWPEFDRRHLFEICFVGPQPVWRKSLHKKYGYFDENFKSAGDYEFWLRISASEKFKHVNQILGLYLLSMNSVENSDRKTSLNESEIAREKHWKAKEKRPAPSGAYLVFQKETKLRVPDPQFSVVVHSDDVSTLRNALNSLTQQTNKSFEVVIVSGGNKDLSKIIDEYNGKVYIRYLHHVLEKNKAEYFNSAIKTANETHITFLNNAVYYPEHLQLLADEIKNGNEIVYTDCITAVYEGNGGEKKLKYKHAQFSVDYDRNKLLLGIKPSLNNFCISKKAALGAGLFDEKLSGLEDWEFLLRLSGLNEFKHIKTATVESSAECRGDQTIITNDYHYKKIIKNYKKEINKIPDKEKILAEFKASNNINGEKEMGNDNVPGSTKEGDKFLEYFNKATKNIDSKDYKTAAKNLQAAIEYYGHSNKQKNLIEYESLLNLAGNVALYNKDYELAKQYFEEELKHKDDSSTACAGLAELFFIEENYPSAKMMYEWAVHNDPQNSSALLGLKKVNAILQLSEDDNSLEKTAGSEDLLKAESIISLARKNFDDKNFDEALKFSLQAEDIIEKSSLNGEKQQLAVSLNNFKGFCYVGLNKLDHAKDCFENALRSEPDSSDACAGLGEVFYLAGNDEEAKIMFEWAVKNDNKNIFAVEGLKKVNKNLGFEEFHNSLLVNNE